MGSWMIKKEGFSGLPNSVFFGLFEKSAHLKKTLLWRVPKALLYELSAPNRNRNVFNSQIPFPRLSHTWDNVWGGGCKTYVGLP